MDELLRMLTDSQSFKAIYRHNALITLYFVMLSHLYLGD